MGRKKLVSIITVGVLGLVAVFAAISFHTVNAQASLLTPSVPGMIQSGGDRPFRGEMPGGTSQVDLAAALGITTEQLQTAEQTASAEALNQAVSAGLITQEQADQFAANNANGPHAGGFRIPNDSSIDYNALLAKALGISVDQLKTAQQQAFTAGIDQAVKDGALTQDQADLMKARNALANNDAFQTNLKAAYESAMKQAVTDGVITQDQADKILAEQPAFGGFGRGGFGGFEGPHGGPGPHGGKGVPVNPNITPPATIPNNSTPPGGGL
jgi:hypothetical protein